MRAKSELKKIALDLYKGHIFSDRNVPKGDSHLLPNIFMPLFFISKEQLVEGSEANNKMDFITDGDSVNRAIADKFSFIYEYMDQASPMAINGYPMFTSFHHLNSEETKLMFEYYAEIKSKMKEFENETAGMEEKMGTPSC